MAPEHYLNGDAKYGAVIATATFTSEPKSSKSRDIIPIGNLQVVADSIANERQVLANGIVNEKQVLVPLKPSNPPAYWKTFLAAAPFTGLAVHYTWHRLIASGTLQHLIAECANHPIHKSIFKYSFLLDRILCVNTNFVQAALDPSNPPFASGFLASFATCAFIPLIEATRVGVKNSVIKNPLLFGIASQLFGRAVVYPAWWATFVSSGAALKEPADSKGSEITQYDAEATLVAMLFGILTPTSSLSLLKSRYWMTTWFVYPVTSIIIRELYKWGRQRFSGSAKIDKKKSAEYAFYLTLGTYLLGFVSAAMLHIGVMTPCMWHPSQIKRLLEPSLTIIGQDKLSVAQNVFRTIQWDAIIVFTTSLLATLSFARTKTQALKIAVADFLGVALFGSGAALSGVWAWREWRLRCDRETLEGEVQVQN